MSNPFYKNELEQRKEGSKYWKEKNTKVPVPEIDWEAIKKNAPRLEVDTDSTNVQTAGDVKSLQKEIDAQPVTGSDTVAANSKTLPENKKSLGTSAFEALAGLGKGMSKGYEAPAMPKLNKIETPDLGSSPSLELRKAVLARLAGRR